MAKLFCMLALLCAFVAMAAAFQPPAVSFTSNPLLNSHRSPVASARRAGLGALRMGGGNVPRVPYKAPGEQSYQFLDIWNRLYRERILYIGQDLDDEFANQMIAVLLFLQQEDATKGVQIYFNCPGGEVLSVMLSSLFCFSLTVTNRVGTVFPALGIHSFTLSNHKVWTICMFFNPDVLSNIVFLLGLDVMAWQIRAGLAVYDTMNNMGFDITTLNLGIAASISGFLCGAGTPGQRMCLPNARFLLQTPKLEDMGMSQVLYGQASDVSIEASEILRQREKIYNGLCRFTGRSYEQIREDLTRDLYLTAPEAIDYGLIDKVLLPMEKDSKDLARMAADTPDANFGKI